MGVVSKERQVNSENPGSSGHVLDYIARGEYEKAIDTLGELERNSAKSELGEIHFEKAVALGHMKEFEKAMSETEEALRYESSAKIHALKANLLRIEDDLDGALRELDIATEKDAYCEEAYFYRGLVYNEFGKWEDAVENFKTAKAMGVKSEILGLPFAIALANSGANEEATKMFYDLVEKNPQDVNVQVNACKHLFKVGKAEEGNALIDRARQSGLNDQWFNLLRGAWCFKSKDVEGALKELYAIDEPDSMVSENMLELLKHYLGDIKARGDKSIVDMIGVLQNIPRSFKTDSGVIGLYEDLGEYGLISDVYDYWLSHGYGNFVKFYEIKALASIKDMMSMQNIVNTASSELADQSKLDQETLTKLRLQLRVFTDLADTAEKKMKEAAEEYAERKVEFKEFAEMNTADLMDYDFEPRDYAE